MDKEDRKDWAESLSDVIDRVADEAQRVVAEGLIQLGLSVLRWEKSGVDTEECYWAVNCLSPIQEILAVSLIMK